MAHFHSGARPKGSIFIEGEGDKRYWTEKAFNRAGFVVSREKTNPFMTVPSDENDSWQLVSDNAKKEV